MTPGSDSARIAVESAPRLSWVRRLDVRVGAAFALAAGVLALLAFLIGQIGVRDKMDAIAAAERLEAPLRLSRELAQPLDRAQILAGALGNLAMNTGADQWDAQVGTLVQSSRLGANLAAVGLWLEPREGQPESARNSRYWQLDNQGRLQARQDYNDPRVVSYREEAWYAPARLAPGGRCYWTPIYRDALQKTEVLSCALPLRGARGFAGVITVSLKVQALDRLLRSVAAPGRSYALLVDRDNRLIGIGGQAAEVFGNQRPANLPQLAQTYPALNPLSLRLHEQDAEFTRRVQASSLYDASQIATLQKRTRGLSRQEAESAMSLIWSLPAITDAAASVVEQIRIAEDPWLGEPALAQVVLFPEPRWKLIQVSGTREGAGAAGYYMDRALLAIYGLVALTLVLAFLALRRVALQPLTALARLLSARGGAHPSVLPESGPEELAIIARAFNDRAHHWDEARSRAEVLQSQLAADNAARVRLEEQAALYRERYAMLARETRDAVILTDERGRIEEMNPVAEQLTGQPLRGVQGAPLDAAFHGRQGKAPGHPLPNLAEISTQSGKRLAYEEEIFLVDEHRKDREIELSVSPLRGTARTVGAAIVFRPRTAEKNLAVGVTGTGDDSDPVTGLPARLSCDRHLRRLLDRSKLSGITHALIVADIDGLRRINESEGSRAGDQVLVRAAERLAMTAKSGEVFRVGAGSFAVAIENCAVEHARGVAEKMREQLANQPVQWEARPLRVTASFGVCAIDAQVEHPLELLRRASVASDAAKRAGGNVVQIYEQDTERSAPPIDEAQWVRRIRAGLSDGFLHLTTQWLQASHLLEGEGQVHQVLMALEDEEGFWAEPARFMPIAVRHQLAGQVDRWALLHTVETLARAPELISRLSFCTLELSAGTLNDSAGLLDMLVQLLQQHPHLPPSKLCFALGREVLEERADACARLAETLRSIGCRVLADHGFGGGRADVERLKKMPSDFLRIDAQHFADLSADALDQTLADALLRTARLLQRRVLVCHVDNSAVLDAWHRLGADYLQGLAIARSSPVVFSTP
jgi:diguanylate cyclase (GGDEF)-like protein